MTLMRFHPYSGKVSMDRLTEADEPILWASIADVDYTKTTRSAPGSMKVQCEGPSPLAGSEPLRFQDERQA